MIVFDAKNYRSFLTFTLDSDGKRSGKRLRAAAAMGCQSTYLSQVTKGQAELSLELAEKFCRFASLNDQESRYFLLLVQHDRAGTTDLKSFFKKELDSIQSQRALIKNRVGNHELLNEADHVKYYSHWAYGALHIGVTLPFLKDAKQLANYFGLPLNFVSDVIDFLKSRDLIELKNGRYEIGSRHLHLSNQSDHILKHHMNWRLKNLESLNSIRSKDLHYSVAMVCSKNDYLEIRELLLKCIETAMQIVKTSADEEAYCLLIDSFSLQNTKHLY